MVKLMLKRSASRIKESERGSPHEVRAPDGWLRRNDLAGVVERNEQIGFPVIRMNIRRRFQEAWGSGPRGEKHHVSGFSAGLVLQFFTSVTLLSQAYP